MLIDTETARNLELIEGVSKQKAHSLYGSVWSSIPSQSKSHTTTSLLNSTFTPQGSRLLRTTILCPMTSLNAIDARLSAVSELVQSEETFDAVRGALKGLQKVDLDKLIIQLAALDRRAEDVENTVKVAYDKMGHLLDLQKVIKNIPAVGRATSDCKCTLLRVIGEARASSLASLEQTRTDWSTQLVSDPKLEAIHHLIGENLNESLTGSKKVFCDVSSGLLSVLILLSGCRRSTGSSYGTCLCRQGKSFLRTPKGK